MDLSFCSNVWLLLLYGSCIAAMSDFVVGNGIDTLIRRLTNEVGAWRLWEAIFGASQNGRHL
jgi:hypothetical protein